MNQEPINFQTHPVVLKQYANTVEMPDGSKKLIEMPPERWLELEFLEVVEGIKQRELSIFAIEEMSHRDEITFAEGFRMVVAHLAGRWK